MEQGAGRQRIADAKLWARQHLPRLYRLLWFTERSVLYGGSRFRCIVCDRGMRRWKKDPTNTWEAICPWCESRARHRRMWLWISRETDLLSEPRRLLHIAPEQGLRERFASADQVTYVTGDLDSPLADVSMDLCAVPFAPDSFDAIVCSHVLEHIPDDGKAMSELARILRPGGWALVMTPFWPERRTDEDPSASSEERLRRFGQEDHVRTYGGDYIDRLHDAGFDVEFEMYGTKFENRFARKKGLPLGEFLIAGWKPAVDRTTVSSGDVVEREMTSASGDRLIQLDQTRSKTAPFTTKN